MQRELKFRMPILNSDGTFKEWFYWGWGVGIADEFTGPHSGYRNCPSEQFTGLKDKNGVDIYEGDILRRNMEYTFEGKPAKHYDDWIVVYTNGSFLTVKKGEKPNPYSQRFCECVIIGNTTENPELLI